MIDVILKADCQKLSVTKCPDVIAAGTKRVLRLIFNVSSEWFGYRVAADFGTEAVPVIGNRCFVPDSVTDSENIRVRLVGMRGDECMTTTTANITQRRW